MINELIKKYQDNLNGINDEQQKFEEEKHNTKDNNYREYCLCIIERCKEAKSIYKEILKDLEELKEQVRKELYGQDMTIAEYKGACRRLGVIIDENL